MTAAALLRYAVEAAPALRVEKDADGYLTIWDTDDRAVLQQRYLDTGSHETDLAVVRLLGLLLAAAPHLADLLDAEEGHALGLHDVSEVNNRFAELRDAITEAGDPS